MTSEDNKLYVELREVMETDLANLPMPARLEFWRSRAATAEARIRVLKVLVQELLAALDRDRLDSGSVAQIALRELVRHDED